MNKKELSERDICSKFINPALEKTGWDINTQITEEFTLTKGRIIVRGKLLLVGKKNGLIMYYFISLIFPLL